MTQLIIAGTEVVLPQGFAVTVKRENSFFTKNGEYTYDCTLKLDNPTNRTLYGFLHRLNKADQLDTHRTAVLIADGRVYANGTEVITHWTQDDVTIQIVSGESELNYFIGQDKKIKDLDLGHIDGRVRDGAGIYPDSDYCEVPIRAANGVILNHPLGGHAATYPWATTNERPQPYLCAIVRRLVTALGYTLGTNQLEDTQFKYLFLINTTMTTEYAKMIPGWTVKDFLTEVERLTGVVFVTDNEARTCDIIQKTIYYQTAQQFTIRNVVDAYEAELADDDSKEAEFRSSDVSYELPDGYWSKLMKLPEGYLDSAEVVDYADLSTVVASAFDTNVVKHDLSTDRYYINVQRDYLDPRQGETTVKFTVEVNQFENLDRQDTGSMLELKITPAPMAQIGLCTCEIISLGSDDGYRDSTSFSGSTAIGNDNSDSGDESGTAEDAIRSYEKKETNAGDIYCAFNNGATGWSIIGTSRVVPLVYTDAYHAIQQGLLHPEATGPSDMEPAGSLRLKDLDADYYQGGYQIDTAHAMTFETYDPNVIDPRQVYVIRNRRFVVRDVEETLTAEGRQKRWKLTCYPITITDTALENRWVLTDSVWDDGGAWLDDGRWLDGE